MRAQFNHRHAGMTAAAITSFFLLGGISSAATYLNCSSEGSDKVAWYLTLDYADNTVHVVDGTGLVEMDEQGYEGIRINVTPTEITWTEWHATKPGWHQGTDSFTLHRLTGVLEEKYNVNPNAANGGYVYSSTYVCKVASGPPTPKF